MFGGWRNGILAGVGVLAVSVGLACGSGANAPVGGSSAAGSGQATVAADPRAGWPKKFTVGYFGGDDAEALLKKQDGFKSYLEKQLGMPVELFTGTSYGAVIEAMRADRLDAMTVGPFAYVLGVQEAQAEALATSISCAAAEKECKYDAARPPYYQSVIFAKKGNGITKLDDFRGKGFNFVDPASASGHLAPKTLLIKKGFDPDKEFKTVFAGSHPTAVLSVWNDKAPGGGTNEGNLLSLVTNKQIEACLWADGQISKPRTQAEIRKTFDDCPNGKIAILDVTDPIPNTAFSIRSEMPATFKQAVKDALLGLKDDPALVGTLRYWYADPHESLGLKNLDQFYNPLRDIARLLKLDLKEMAEKG